MIWIILLVLATIGSFVWVASDEYAQQVDKAAVPFFTFLIGAFIVLMLIAIIDIATGDEHDTEVSEKRELVAVKDGSQINGSFGGSFLGFSGSIGESPVYSYYWKNADGAIVRGEIDSANAVVIETNEYSPQIELFTEVETEYGWSFWTYDMPQEDRFNGAVIYVPEGSVTAEFELDLEG